MAYEWLIASSLLLLIWGAIFIARPRLRKEMLLVSSFTAPLGLTEPIFVPVYWTPPSLFNLAANTGFDIESLIFCFASGGIAAVLYEAVARVRHRHMGPKEIQGHRLHRFALIVPVLVFIPLYLLSALNPIYTASLAMLAGAIATYISRPDLKREMLLGALMYTGLYFIFFLFINILEPHFINSWNLAAISGIVLLGVPVEELMFAFTFGLMWSSVYEHYMWEKLTRASR
jgi:hypothetical protein